MLSDGETSTSVRNGGGVIGTLSVYEAYTRLALEIGEMGCVWIRTAGERPENTYSSSQIACRFVILKFE